MTKTQKQTVQHLKEIHGITEVMDIIKWCVDCMDRPRRSGKHFKARRRGTATKNGIKRKRPVKYYQEIINHYAQQR